jgi:hypothetical protein
MIEVKHEGGSVNIALDGEPLELIADIQILLRRIAAEILTDAASPADAMQYETMMLAGTKAAIITAFEEYQAKQAAQPE